MKMTKTCGCCKTDKPVEAFWVHKKAPRTGRIFYACIECLRARMRAAYAKNPEKYKALQTARNRANGMKPKPTRRACTDSQFFRAKVLSAYGGKCACCGETEAAFLAVDHIFGGGGKHRKSVHGHIYPWLVRNGYPAGFRLLCHNCNCARGYYGYCPHEVAAYDVPYAVRMEA